MKIWLLIVGVVSLAAPAVASAPLPPSAYSAEFHACMDDAAGAPTPMRMCLGNEFDRVDADLNATYRTLMRTLPSARRQRLLTDERAWLRRTSRMCAHAGDGEAGGALQPVQVDSCTLDQTILRARRLHSWS